MVNTALSSTFSDSREKRMLLAGMPEEAFFIRSTSSNSSPATMSAGMVSKLSTMILAWVRSFSLNSPSSSSLSLLWMRT